MKTIRLLLRNKGVQETTRKLLYSTHPQNLSQINKVIFQHNVAAQNSLLCCKNRYPKHTNLNYSVYFGSEDTPINMADNKFSTDYDKFGRASCKKCKKKFDKGELRVAKVTSNFFHDGDGEMKQYHHPECIFESFIRARATTKIIEDTEDLDGFDNLEDDDKQKIKELITDTLDRKGSPKKTPKKKAAAVQSTLPFPSPRKDKGTDEKKEPKAGPSKSKKDDYDPRLFPDPSDKDNSFRQFRRLCADIADVGSHIEKSKHVSNYIKKGSSGDGFTGDVYLVIKLLLPGVVKTVYNLNGKQLVKIYSQIFGAKLSEMVEDLEQGDVAETIKIFFEKSKKCPPIKKSVLSIQEVHHLLLKLSKVSKEDDQLKVLKQAAQRSTANDLKMFVRLIKHDLRINAGAKHILEGLDPNAYEAFQASRNLKDVVDRVKELHTLKEEKPHLSKKLSIKASLMTPVLPMLAEACKSVEQAFKKCPNGIYSEIKYDGERVQVHKKGDKFEYYSRSLKPVLPHKVGHFKEWIPKAFTGGSDLILDAEVLLIDTNTSKPLPFGTLGKHKKEQFQDANVCLFIFDCLHYNGESLMDKTLKERKKILRKNMKEIPNRILFSEMEHITEPAKLKAMMMKVFKDGLEGLVLKDVNGIYEPGKRHWLKVKKDYLAEGAMADTADLVVLGAFFGTGNKGGLMSIFLMGCFNPDMKKWVTVTKCGSGFDDKTLDKLQKQFDMVKISKDYSKVPKWLHMNKSLTPDFLVRDPKASEVWEITGAEFSKSDSHTAGGISIRFPRCTKMRDDKSWEEATDLPRLKELYKTSKECSDIPDVLGVDIPGTSNNNSNADDGMDFGDDSDDDGKPKTPKKGTPVKGSPVKTPKKRPATDDVDSSPSKRTKYSKPVCKYGSTCYQKSEDHRRNFDHPNGPTTSPSKNLPDVFRGMVFYLPSDVDKYEQLKRYIIAFDGDVVPEYEKDNATHIVSESKSASKNTVTTAWLWNCIKQKKLVPI